MIIEFEKKISIEGFNKLFHSINEESKFNLSLNDNTKNIKINLSKVEWISAEALTLLFGWLNNIRHNKPDCFLEIDLPNPSVIHNIDSLEDFKINAKRREKRLISLLYDWEIQKSCNLAANSLTGQTYINKKIVKREKKITNKDPNWQKIIPFKVLNTASYKAKTNVREHLNDHMSDLFNIEKDIYKLLTKFSTQTPFDNKTLSHLVTVELFLNSVQHSDIGICNNIMSQSYFSIVLNNRFNKEDIKDQLYWKRVESLCEEYNLPQKTIIEDHSPQIKKDEIEKQYNYRVTKLLKKNIENERQKLTWDFFKNKNKKYKNISYLEFTYLDFGIGIPATLKEKYLDDIENGDIENQLNKGHFKCANIDTKILEYACLLSTSRHPFEANIEIQDFVPRGLYFLVDIISRYHGLVSIKSGYGEIIFDFSLNQSIKNAVRYSSLEYYFPGTIYNILIPEKKVTEVEISAIESPKKTYKTQEIKREYVNLLDIFNRSVQNHLQSEKIDQYNIIFKELNHVLDKNNDKKTVYYIDFAGVEQSYINIKIFHYLANTPKINSDANVVLINVNDRGLLLEAQKSIAQSTPFIHRPIPCIFIENNKKSVVWIGIKNSEDQDRLNELLRYEDDFTLPASDFHNPELLKGNIIELSWVDKNENSGNIRKTFNIPSLNEIRYVNCIYPVDTMLDRIENHEKFGKKKLLIEKENTLFLTAGGYYQKEFLQFYDLLFDSDENGYNYSYKIAIDLINMWMFDKGDFPEVDFIISVTLSSQILGRGVQKRYCELNKFNKKEPILIKLTHYYDFINEYGLESLKEKPNSKVLIVTDVISTGNLIQSIFKTIVDYKSEVQGVLAIADCGLKGNNTLDSSLPDYLEKITVSLLDYPIEKSKDINTLSSALNPEVIRINPLLNIPITMEEKNSVLNESVLLPDFNSEVDLFENNDILIGYFQNNNSYHSYYFNTKDIFQKEYGKNFLRKIFNEFNKKFERKVDILFLPMFSGVENIKDTEFKDYLGNSNLFTYNMPRIDSQKGWRFTFPPKFLNEKTKNKTALIVDDGSCSGSTLIQMIDTISFLELESIAVLSFFCRIDSYQREFFSRLNSIKVKKFKDHSKGENEIKLIDCPIKVFFGIQAFISHYPYEKSSKFLEERQNIKKLNKGNVIFEFEKFYNLRQEELKIQNLQKGVLSNFMPDYFMNSSRKEVLKIRNTIGKLEGYLIYKDFFRELEKISQDQIKILIGIVIHEPRLITIIKHLAPETFVGIKNYLDKSIFNEEKYNIHLLTFLRCYFLIDADRFRDINFIKCVLKIIDQNEDQISYDFLIYIFWGNLNNLTGKTHINSLLLIYELLEELNNGSKNFLYFKTKLSNLITYSYKISDENNVIEGFVRLRNYFKKIDNKRNHFDFSDKLRRVHLELKNYSDTNFHKNFFVKIQEGLDKCEKDFYVLKDNLDKINSYEGLKENIGAVGTIFRDENFYYLITFLIEKMYNIENIKNNKNAINKLIKMIERIQKKIGPNGDFRRFCENFPCNIEDTWETAINNFDTKKLDNIDFNLSGLNSNNSRLFIHKNALEFVFIEIIQNMINFVKIIDKPISLEYSIHVEGGQSKFIIRQNHPPKNITDSSRGLGLNKIATILNIFEGEIDHTASNFEKEYSITITLRNE